jgi:ribose transport system permease protein/inositol transport system permease protein
MSNNRNSLKKIDWSSIGITLALIVMFIFFSIFGNNFLSSRNVINIFRQVAVIGICAVGMTGVILTGGIDLSVGSVLGLTAVSSALFMADGMPIFLAVIISLMIGVSIGVINAFVIDRLKMPPLIMTLGTNTALRGVIYLICGGMPVYGLPESYRFLGQGNILGIPTQVYILIIVFILGYIIYNKTVFGREIYGLGGNPEATRLSGVNTSKTIYKIYIYEAFLASLAGLILLSRVNSGQPSLGDAYEMDIITAVVLGGVSVAGGEGKFSRVIIGVLFMGVLANGMNMMNIGDYWQRVVKGLALVIAVAIDLLSKQQKAKA